MYGVPCTSQGWFQHNHIIILIRVSVEGKRHLSRAVKKSVSGYVWLHWLLSFKRYLQHPVISFVYFWWYLFFPKSVAWNKKVQPETLTFKMVDSLFLCMHVTFAEDARVQEDTASSDLPNLKHDATQLCCLDGNFAHLLFRVWRPLVGSGSTGGAVHRVWGQVPWEMQRSAQRRLSTT